MQPSLWKYSHLINCQMFRIVVVLNMQHWECQNCPLLSIICHIPRHGILVDFFVIVCEMKAMSDVQDMVLCHGIRVESCGDLFCPCPMVPESLTYVVAQSCNNCQKQRHYGIHYVWKRVCFLSCLSKYWWWYLLVSVTSRSLTDVKYSMKMLRGDK
jgi:hypothetical protein